MQNEPKLKKQRSSMFRISKTKKLPGDFFSKSVEKTQLFDLRRNDQSQGASSYEITPSFASRKQLRPKRENIFRDISNGMRYAERPHHKEPSIFSSFSLNTFESRIDVSKNQARGKKRTLNRQQLAKLASGFKGISRRPSAFSMADKQT